MNCPTLTRIINSTMDLHKAVRIAFVLSCALSATTAVSTPWRSVFAPRAYCSSPGEVICSSDCTEVQLCMGNPDGSYDPQTMITCDEPSGLVCSADAKKCVPKAESPCQPSENTFKCNGVGSYPDPFDCKTYHVCLPGEQLAIKASCSSDTDEAYNPCTGDCTLTTSDRVCTEKPVKTCNESLERGVVPENPNIYFICKPDSTGQLLPEMYRCAGGEVFDLDLVSCVATSGQTTCQTTQKQQPRRQSLRAQKTP